MELLHNLNFARGFDTLWLPEPGLLYHTDAGSRQSKDRPSDEECRQHAAEALLIIEQHADVLRVHAPKFLEAQYRRIAVLSALAGDRSRALGTALSRTMRHPLDPLNWACLASVSAGKDAIARALNLKWWLVEERRKRMCRTV